MMKMKTRYYRLLTPLFVLMALLMAACSSDSEVTTDQQQPLPEGMGRIRITICTPEMVGETRAVEEDLNDPNRPGHDFPWETPDHDWEKLQSYRILICNTDNKVVKIISGTTMGNASTSSSESLYRQSAEITTEIPAGSYHIFATANYDDGYTVDPESTVDYLNQTVKFPNGYSSTSTDYFGDVRNIPMTGKLTDSNGLKTITLAAGDEINAGTIVVWRVIGKLQFEFTNEADHKIQILGVEAEPINQASSTGPGIYLFSKDDLTSEANLVPMFANGAEKKGVTATWPLNTSTLQTAASVSMGGVFSATELTYGSKLAPSSLCTAGKDAYKTTLQMFRPTEKVDSRNNAAVISFKVTPKSGMTFVPKNLTFKACRGGTDDGYFDVEVIGGGTTITLATDVRPERYNVSPYLSTYSYPLSGITGEVEVRIYVYNLAANKDYAFSDVAISGDITNNTGSALQEFITLPDGARTDVGTVVYEPSTPLELAANGTGTLFFYVNETDATYTTTDNQLSLRFKIKRQKGSEWYDDEIRFGVTTHYSDGTPGHDGFNVIRRNDWIHIPIHLTDWQFRVEPLAFVPIGGYPATMLSSDALTATFSTGGYIILQPFAQKNNDGTWRDFTDTEVTFVSLTWKNSDGTNVSGTGKIFETAPTYDAASGRILGVLNNSLAAGTYKTSVTVNVKLGPSGSQYDYAFTFNVVLQK